MGAAAPLSGPDFSQGVTLAQLPESGTVAGRVGEEPVLLSRLGGELFAVGGACTHYGAPLGAGLAADEAVRCPLHHACFSLRTGLALRAPAFDGLPPWVVEVEGPLVFVRRKAAGASPATPAPAPADVQSVVIAGGGAAAFACADELRRLGYQGSLVMACAEADPPCDRPNLSKDYLAGAAPEEWIPLRDEDYYRRSAIDLRLATEIAAIDLDSRTAFARGGEAFRYDRLLIATGAEPVRLAGPGFDRADVHRLRSLADARAIVARARPGAVAAVIGSSFIGLEAAAALRARGVAVHVVSKDLVPFDRLLGSEAGLFLQRLHERNGVIFHLGRTVDGFDGRTLRLDDGAGLEADFLVVGIGVRPRTALAEAAHLAVGDGVLVDARLETGVSGIFAAGDVAAFPDPRSGRPVRIEHWVTAQRQGQVAAANMLGGDVPFRAVPFFWTEQYGVALRFVGGAGWDEIRLDGDVAGGDFTARYYERGELRASASVGRDLDNLEDERRLEALLGEAAGAPGPGREPSPRSGIQSANAASGGTHGFL
ncbi:MAG TPA: FAD-dependent oxidoreductase [Allosphingosinicella sp.]|nr:FAD-dependent oxidoreductase [Allosphingosinicella sp.]